MRWNQKYSREKMFDLVAEYLSSNITQSDLCKREGFSRGTFKYWYRKYRSTDLKVVDSEVSSPSKASSDFIAISVPEITEEVPFDLEITYPNGVRLQLSTVLNEKGLTSVKELVSCLG